MDGTGAALAAPSRKDMAMGISDATRPIPPTAVRRAFGEDRDHPAFAGIVRGIAGNALLVAVACGTWLEVVIDDVAFAQALRRDDLCRQQHRLVALLNASYGLIGLAFARPRPRCGWPWPTAVGIPGEAPQPSWLHSGAARPVEPGTPLPQRQESYLMTSKKVGSACETHRRTGSPRRDTGPD